LPGDSVFEDAAASDCRVEILEKYWSPPFKKHYMVSCARRALNEFLPLQQPLYQFMAIY
jgi:hypothetical protein